MSIVTNVLFLSVLKLVFLTVFLRIFLPFLLEAKKHNIPALKFGVRILRYLEAIFDARESEEEGSSSLIVFMIIV